MAYTAQQVFDMALQRSDLNNSDLIPSAQVLNYLTNFERAVFLRAARLNPDYFGTNGNTSVRSTWTSVWNLLAAPGNIAALMYTEVNAIAGTVTGISVGDRVNIVGVRWKNLDIAPRVILRGRTLTPIGSELGGADANMVTQLKVYYSPLPQALTSLAQGITLPDEFADLLVLPLARVMAVRDSRLEESQVIQAEYNDAFGLFSEAILVYDHGMRRPFGSVPAIPVSPSQG